MKFEEFKNEQKPKRNYYEVLEVKPSATSEEIKSAFRKLAKATHPDLAGDAKKEEFQEVEEAYTVLSDESKRAEYDRKNLIQGEESNEKNENENENSENADEDWEEFKKEASKDKELMMMLMLSKNMPGMEEEFKKVLNSSYKVFKMKKQHEKESRELRQREEELDRMQEELRGGNFQSSSFSGKTREHNNIRDIDESLGIERDILGNERLVDLKTGRQIGYSSYKIIEFVSGAIIATDIIGNKYVLNRKGDRSFESFRDIQVRDGLVIGKDILDNEKLIDKHTGETISRGMYKKIIREGGKIYGINILGRKEEI